jgi:transmembrane sensor
MNSPLDAQTRAIHEAADWYARLRGEPSTPALEQDWQNWLASSETNRQAWLRVETVCGRFQQIPGQLSIPALSAPNRRRAALRSFVLFAVLGTSGAMAYRQAPWREWSSDYHTATGERRDLRLADGSRLLLNTRSAVDVRFDGEQRLIQLHAGEVLVTTHLDPMTPPRPFRVVTAQGSILALGTRFTVRVDDGLSTVAVLEKAVEVSPWQQRELRQRVTAGERISFGTRDIGALQTSADDAAAWENGRLIVVDRPLVEVLAELSRYRSGHLGCSPAIAHWRISGAFPLDDTDEALLALAESFPLQIEYRTRYWVRVVARSG